MDTLYAGDLANSGGAPLGAPELFVSASAEGGKNMENFHDRGRYWHHLSHGCSGVESQPKLSQFRSFTR